MRSVLQLIVWPLLCCFITSTLFLKASLAPSKDMLTRPSRYWLDTCTVHVSGRPETQVNGLAGAWLTCSNRRVSARSIAATTDITIIMVTNDCASSVLAHALSWGRLRGSANMYAIETTKTEMSAEIAARVRQSAIPKTAKWVPAWLSSASVSPCSVEVQPARSMSAATARTRGRNLGLIRTP